MRRIIIKGLEQLCSEGYRMIVIEIEITYGGIGADVPKIRR